MLDCFPRTLHELKCPNLSKQGIKIQNVQSSGKELIEDKLETRYLSYLHVPTPQQ